MNFSSILRRLLSDKIFVHRKTFTKLLHASRTGDLKQVNKLLDSFPSLVRFKQFQGKNTPLHIAAANEHVEIVELFLKFGADVNVRNGVGQTPLMVACRLGRMRVVQVLLIFNAQIELVDGINGCNALHYAAGSGFVECLRLCLADYVPSIPVPDRCINMSQSDFSRWQDCPTSTLNEILNLRANGGITALHLASFYGKFECLRLLLNLGAWVDATSVCEASFETDVIGNHSSALHFAAFNGSRDCFEILLSYGADPTQKNENGLTPLDVASIRRHHYLKDKIFEARNNFPASSYLAYPLCSVMKIAREIGLKYKYTIDSDISDLSGGGLSSTQNTNKCEICFERVCVVESRSCKHRLCCHCALQICCSGQSHSSSQELNPSMPSSSAASFSTSFLSPSTISSPTTQNSESSSVSTPIPSFASAPDVENSSEVHTTRLDFLAGSIPCPFCRSPIQKFHKIKDLKFGDSRFELRNTNHVKQGKELKLDFLFTDFPNPVDWLSLKLPSGTSLKEFEIIEDARVQFQKN